MSKYYTTKQNHASIKAFQLVKIAQEIAHEAGLAVLSDDLAKVVAEIEFYHKASNNARKKSSARVA